MSSLYLIRHGQAVYASPEPTLSELGVHQAGLLGRWVSQRGIRLDAVYCGPRRRQIDTARHLLAAASSRDAEAPARLDLQVVDELDEYPAETVLRAWLPTAADARPVLSQLSDAGLDAATRWRLLSPFLWRASTAWMRGELEVAESFPRFAERVRGALVRIREREGRGKRVAVVTSAGPVGASLRWALRLDDPATLALAWAVHNTSLTELRYRDESPTVAAFNSVPHLPPELIT